MATRFRGEWVHRVDQKGRVSVPSEFRRMLDRAETAPDTLPSIVMVAQPRGRRCIECHSLAGFEELENRILAVEDYFDQERLLDEIVARAQTVQLDENGRMLIGTRLREALGIGEQVVFLGKVEKFEIWVPEVWEAERERIEAEIRDRPRELDPFRHLARRPRPPGAA